MTNLAWWHAIAGAEAAEVQPSDLPGTLNIGATRTSRGASFATVLTDLNGIRAITSSVGTRSDGETRDYDLVRRNENTFVSSVASRGAVWRSGSLTVVYVEAATGESRTITQSWSV